MDNGTRTHGTEATTPLARERVVERQREEFGGFSWGSIFFGWLVAVGLGALLAAVLTGAGAAIGITELTLAGGILLIAALLVSYYAGGYVAGRLARFDGGRQGLGVWLLGLLVTAAFAAVAAIAGSEWNVFEQLNLPRIPVDEGSLTTGGLVTLLAIVAGTLLAAFAGGKFGQRFHHRVDRIAFEQDAIR